LAQNLAHDCVDRAISFREGFQYSSLVPMSDIESRYYLRINVQNKTGVLGKIATLLSNYDVSISDLMQLDRNSPGKEEISIIILTHTALESDIRKAVTMVERYPEVNGKVKLIRVEDL